MHEEMIEPADSRVSILSMLRDWKREYPAPRQQISNEAIGKSGQGR